MAEMILTVRVRDDSNTVSLHVKTDGPFRNVPLGLQRAVESIVEERDQYQLCPHHRANPTD